MDARATSGSGLPPARTRHRATTRPAQTIHLLLAIYALAGFAVAAWIAFRITHQDLLPDAAITGRWSAFDWLSNYQGGFVRRGFLGEAILGLADITGIAPTNLVFAGMLGAYAAQALLLVGLFRGIPDASPALLVIFAPFMLGFEVLTTSAIGRKDVIFLVVLSAVAFLHARGKAGASSLAPEIALAILPFLVLTHEAFFLFSPYLLVFGLIDSRSRAHRLRLAALWSLSLVAFIAAILNHGSAHAVAGICGALSRRIDIPGFGPSCTDGGAIALLKASAAQGWEHFRQTYGDPTQNSATPAILLIVAGFLPLAGFVSQLRANRPRVFVAAVVGAGAALAMSLPLFLVADDWGRWLHIHAAALGILLAALLARGQMEGWAAPGPLAARVFGSSAYLVLAVLYATMWDLNVVGDLIGGGFMGKTLGLAI
jgi:hypothetical protein